MAKAAILATGSYLPDKIITNEMWEGTSYLFKGDRDTGSLDRSDPKIVTDEKIYETSGIKERRKASSSDTLEMMALQAFLNTGFPASRIDDIIVATSSNRDNFPSIASGLHSLILRINDGCGTTDISNACTGFATGLKYASYAALAGRRTLVVGTERLTDYLDPEDRNSNLFGDGASACVIGPSSHGGGVLSIASMTDSTAKDLIFQDKDGYLRLDGPKVFEKAVDGVFDTTKRALEDAGFSSKDLTYFIGHNANKRILDRVSRKMRKIGCDAETLSTIKYSGNTSTASIGLTLDKYIRDGTIHRGDLIALAGVGSGMGYETLIIRM